MACIETYATLCIFSATLSPEAMSERLGIQATDARPMDTQSKYKHRSENHSWSWSTKDRISSTDNLLHIKAIVDILEDKGPTLKSLRESDCQIDISSFWLSDGQGGPSLDATTMQSLSNLGLDIWWDVYFEDDGNA